MVEESARLQPQVQIRNYQEEEMTNTQPGGVMPGDVQIDGRWYIRSFVVELEPGDVTALGETVLAVHRLNDHRTTVEFTNGYRTHYGRADSTMLVEAIAH